MPAKGSNRVLLTMFLWSGTKHRLLASTSGPAANLGLGVSSQASFTADIFAPLLMDNVQTCRNNGSNHDGGKVACGPVCLANGGQHGGGASCKPSRLLQPMHLIAC
jgi:hypothetical protein